SGKSTVAVILQGLGAKIINTDELAREVVAPGQLAYRQIIDVFGCQVLRPDGLLDRRILGQIIFNDETARKQLNAITHPPIRERVAICLKKWRQKKSKTVVVIEAPLLIEAGMGNMVDTIWVVTAPAAIRLARIMRRDNLTFQEAKSRLQAQKAGEKEQLRQASIIIDNSGSLKETGAVVLAAWKKLMEVDK
ncbi:MAG: dephospho-CoA kinase, partial [Firmicutes bacterium]|nr:dephospho-CoA kinase [Bacillota bacterium]